MSKLAKFSIAGLSLIVSQVFAADTPPTFYGGLYVDVRSMGSTTTKTYEDGTKEVTKTTTRPYLFDNGSRMGVRGSMDIAPDTEFLYRVEWRSPMESESRNFESRDSWLAVKHKKYGTLKAGRLLSPEAYFRYTYDYPTWGADSNRSNNAVRYESPKFKDTEVWLHYVTDENNDTDLLGRDGYGVVVKHEKKDKYGLAAAYFGTDSQKTLHGVKFKDQLRVTGFYQMTDKAQLNFIYQTNNFNDVHYGNPSKKNTGVGFGGSYKLTEKDTLYGHVNYAKNPFGKDGDFKSVAIAAERQFTPKFSAFVEYDYYVTDVNVPAHTAEGKSVKAHKEKTEEPIFIIGTAFRF